jgi:transposase
MTASSDRPATPRTRRNRAAIERTITALRRGGRLEPVDAAGIALARHLAAALDVVDPEHYTAQLASLARVHLATLRQLRGMDDRNEGDPDLGELLSYLAAPMPAEVGDTAQP